MTLQSGARTFFKRLWLLVSQPIFVALTIFGNGLIITGAVLLYYLEGGSNPHIHSLLDTIWWAVSTVTSVGYGDVIPLTPLGRIIGIVMMILGTALFWSFTALFAEALISKDISDLEYELKVVERLLKRIGKDAGGQKEDVRLRLKALSDEMSKLVSHS